MPGVSRTHRAEAKYNVTTDFPHLGLHSAAATGNLGLVKYALEHGQPVNSVLDGVLPLHAACSGGNDLVVRLLIENGADVNAPRLPRRYSTEKNRDAPIVGTSGSTPLHFACANGHTDVVTTLLMHGAHPDRPDKHGVTPEALAQQNGWTECADILKEWLHNKDKDLRDRAELTGGLEDTSSTEKETQPFSSGRESSEMMARRLRMKRSIDNALSTFKSSASQSAVPSASTHLADSLRRASDAQPPSPHPLGDYTFYPTSDVNSGEVPPRRPSLPHVFETPYATPQRKQNSGSSSKRPRSAGNDADQSTHKIRSKISLLSIFKKANADASGTFGMSESHSGYNSSSSAITSTSASPAPDAHSVLSSASTPSTHHDTSTSLEGSATSVEGPGRFRSRLMSDTTTATSTRRQFFAELYSSPSSEHMRTRSGSGSGAHPGVDAGMPSHRSPSTRPGILRAHNRSSSGQSQSEAVRHSPPGPQPSARSLRFDSSSTSANSYMRQSGRQSSHSPSRGLNKCNSSDSLHGEREGFSGPAPDSGNIVETAAVGYPVEGSQLDIEEEEEEYGHPIDQTAGPGRTPSESKAERRPRRESLASSKSSLSPLLQIRHRLPSNNSDYPFSINQPPPEDSARPSSSNHPSVHGVVNRARGDSLSSQSTDGSNIIALNSSSTSGYATTSALSHLPTPIVSPASFTPDLPSAIIEGEGQIEGSMEAPRTLPSHPGTPLSPRGPRVPLDMDLRSISTHAQAEALVQRAQQSILEMPDSLNKEESETLGVSLGVGRTPLSAKLAAYGESLAIERRFKEEEERKRSPTGVGQDQVVRDTSGGYVDTQVRRSLSRNALDRKYSLEVQMGRPSSSAGQHQEGDHLRISGESVTPLRRSASAFNARSHILRLQHSMSSIPPPEFIRHASSDLQPPQIRADSEGSHHTRPKIVRSRTPDPETDLLSVTYRLAGVPLSRISTAPVQDASHGLSTSRTVKGSRQRQIARANKLVKMGFSSPDSWHSSSSSTARSPATKHRFGIKTLVQTLTGKS